MSDRYSNTKGNNNNDVFDQTAVILVNGKPVGRISLYKNQWSKADLDVLSGSGISMLLEDPDVTFEAPQPKAEKTENRYSGK